MNTLINDDLILVLQTAGFPEPRNLLAAHLAEIEVEAETVLELLTSLRSYAHHEDAEATQETLAELTIALEHLSHHIQEALPGLQRPLDIQPED